ncbi:MAG: ATP-binding protein, partial [Pseudomonadota bacterium]
GLRDYSRYDDDWDMANIVACLKSTLKLARNEFKSGCKLVVQVSELPDSYFNHGKLAQVFLNLLVNAGHAVDEQGLIEVSCEQYGEAAVVEVSDNGCGIAEEVLERVFEPFFTTKPRGLGTGLGLSISRSIVDAHGGRLTASSQLGIGTTFRVELPLLTQMPTYDSE